MNVRVVCVLFMVVFDVQAQWAIEDDGCRTPDRGVGTCISLFSCKPMTDLLNNISPPFPPQVSSLLQSYHCGFEGRDPKVCCPSKPIQIDGLTDRQPTAPPDVSRHKNINLLPKDCGLIDTRDRIINGNQTGLFEFPWMALLSYRTQRGPDFKCGATIINERYILTAAHCIKYNSYPLLGVRIGEHDINSRIDCEENEEGERVCAPPYQDLAIEEIIPHPKYDRKTFTNDIGLLRVAYPMNLTLENVKPICLPLEKSRNYNFTNRNVVVTGWGVTEKGRSSPVLLKAEVPAVPQEECQKTYKDVVTITHLQVCAGGNTKSDSCAGDSGGPIHVPVRLYGDDRFVQQGVVSFGPKICGQQGLPGVYTRVAYYMDWILDSMRP